MAKDVVDRLHMTGEARENVLFLIKHHLRMSLVAFRRDTEDPEIVRRFAELVGVEDRLKGLCLMTLADVEAVSRETLTPWREELLWRLYVDTYNYLTHAYGDEVIEQGHSGHGWLIEQRPGDLSAAEIAAFLQGFPRRYLQLFSPEAVFRHVRLARDLAEGAVQAWIERKDEEWELTVLARDQPFLFSNISGVLASFGMDILRGFAFTKPGGLVVDMFHFTDEERFLEMNSDGGAELVKTLEAAIAGTLDVGQRLKGREQGAFRRKLPRFAPVIHCDNSSSRRYTIVEIVAENALGLLYRVSRAMSESGCDVDLVLIATEGRRAIDVFHLTRQGRKLTEQEQADVRDNLIRVLEGRHEAHQVDREAQ
jgi:[protein-PII] uridylyltransferase